MKPAYLIKRDYGAAELKRVYGKNLIRGLGISLLINLFAVGMYWEIAFVEPQEEPQARAIRITKYEEIGAPPSITGTSFGLSAYPVITQSTVIVEKKTTIPRVRPGPKTKRQREMVTARGLGGIQAELPSAPGANKIDPAKLLADNEDYSNNRMYDVQNAAGGGGNSNDQFRGGTLIASKDADVPYGNAHSGVGTNLHGVLGGEGNGGGGQGGDADRFGSGSGGSFGYSMSWVQGGMRRKLSGALPQYPPGVNVEAQISILAMVSPDGSIKSVQPAQKANSQLENAAMKELRYWKFEPLRSASPQIDQSCIVTFVFKLK